MPAKKKTTTDDTERIDDPVTPEHPLVMTGLREDNLRDFLAALGALRLTGCLWPECEPKLGWTESGSPILTVSLPLPATWASDIWSFLRAMHDSPVSPFRHGKIEAVDAQRFRQLLANDEEMQFFGGRFLPSLGGQIQYEKGGRRSQLIIESANRSVLNGASELLENERFRPDLAGDLLGLTALCEVSNTPRWHPAEAQSAAYCAADPKDNKLMDRRSLNVMALIGLTFYPVVDRARQRDTLGTFRKAGGDRCFSWPIHAAPLGADAILSLLHEKELHNDEPDATVLRGKGVRMAWRSRKYTMNQNDYFSPAVAIS